jgi:type II secretory pathway component PulF
VNTPVSTIEKILGAVVCFACLYFFAYVYWSIPNYIDLFKGFGAKLPGETRFVLDTYRFWGVFAIAALAGTTMLFTEHRRWGWGLLAPAGVSVVILWPLTVWALYAPIFDMGSQI